MFKLNHILYLIISFLIILLLLIFISKNKDEKKARIIRFILGISLLITLIINRATLVHFNHVYYEPDNSLKPHHMFPNSWCSINALILSIYLIFDIKHHSIAFPIFLGIYGGMVASIIPTYLNKQPFFEIDTLTSLLFHSIMILSCFTLLFTKYYIPYKLDFLYFGFGMLLLELIGFFQIHALKYKESMQVGQPFFDSNPVARVLTGPTVIIISATFLVAIVCILLNIFENRIIKSENYINEAEIDNKSINN